MPAQPRLLSFACTASPAQPCRLSLASRVSCGLQNYRASFQETGDIDSSVWSCGTVMGLIDSVPTCEELIHGMVSEAEGIIKGRLAEMVK